MWLILHIASYITDIYHQRITRTWHLRSRIYFSLHCQKVALFALYLLSVSGNCMTARIIASVPPPKFSLLKAYIPPFPTLISITNFDQPIKFQYNFVLISVSSDNFLVLICKPNLLFSVYKHQPLYKAFPNCSTLRNGEDISFYLKVSFDY